MMTIRHSKNSTLRSPLLTQIISIQHDFPHECFIMKKQDYKNEELSIVTESGLRLYIAFYIQLVHESKVNSQVSIAMTLKLPITGNLTLGLIHGDEEAVFDLWQNKPPVFLLYPNYNCIKSLIIVSLEFNQRNRRYFLLQLSFDLKSSTLQPFYAFSELHISFFSVLSE